MTEERKDGTEEAKPVGKIKVDKVYEIALDSFQKVYPNLVGYSLVRLLSGAVYSLREYVERGEGGINWANPFAQLEYDVDLSEEGTPRPEPEPIPALEVEEEQVTNLEDAQRLCRWIIYRLPKVAEVETMACVTRKVVLRREKGIEDGRPYDGRILVTDALRDELDALPEDARGVKLEELIDGYKDLDSIITGTGTVTTAAGPQDYAFSLLFYIQPLTLDPVKHRAYFPICTGLNFTKGDPSTWSEEDQKALWKALSKGIDEHLDTLFVRTEEEIAEAKKTPVLKPDRVRAVRPEDFAVAAGFVPMHHLAERNRGGYLLFPDERRQFFELRTPLNWAVGLALFSCTSEKTPEAWQEVKIRDLEDRVFCLTDRAAPRHGQLRADILAEVAKLHTTRNCYVRYNWERRGRAWRRIVALGSDYAIPNLELVYRDKKGRRVIPSDPAIRHLVVPLEVKGRRVMKPDGKDIKALPRDRFSLDCICWRWNPSFADDLKAAPALDIQDKIKRDATGKVLRGGFNIRVAIRIFDALTILRSERAYVAHDLLVLLAHDIYKPPKQSTTAGRNVVEREADRLFDLLGLDADPKHPDRREKAVAGAVYRLKQPDIAALLPGSDESPRADPNPNRRKGLYYRLIRSPEYTPAAALVTKEEAAVLEAEVIENETPAALPALPIPKIDQAVLPGMEAPVAPPIPSGADIRAAREAAGVTLRDFARMMKGPSFFTWSMIETGQRKQGAGRIPSEVWQRVRDFIAKHSGKGSE